MGHPALLYLLKLICFVSYFFLTGLDRTGWDGGMVSRLGGGVNGSGRPKPAFLAVLAQATIPHFPAFSSAALVRVIAVCAKAGMSRPHRLYRQGASRVGVIGSHECCNAVVPTASAWMDFPSSWVRTGRSVVFGNGLTGFNARYRYFEIYAAALTVP